MPRPKVTPFLWFDHQAEQAAQFYVSLFPNSRVTKKTRHGDASPGPPGSVWTVEFELDGAPLIALNGGPHYKLTEAFSLSVDCQSQAEVDTLWEKLSAGGQTLRCGWLTDRYGLTWQIVPSVLGELLSSSDAAVAQRVMQAMLPMTKLEIQKLLDAAAGSQVDTPP